MRLETILKIYYARFFLSFCVAGIIIYMEACFDWLHGFTLLLLRTTPGKKPNEPNTLFDYYTETLALSSSSSSSSIASLLSFTRAACPSDDKSPYSDRIAKRCFAWYSMPHLLHREFARYVVKREGREGAFVGRVHISAMCVWCVSVFLRRNSCGRGIKSIYIHEDSVKVKQRTQYSCVRMAKKREIWAEFYTICLCVCSKDCEP